MKVNSPLPPRFGTSSVSRTNQNPSLISKEVSQLNDGLLSRSEQSPIARFISYKVSQVIAPFRRVFSESEMDILRKYDRNAIGPKKAYKSLEKIRPWYTKNRGELSDEAFDFKLVMDSILESKKSEQHGKRSIQLKNRL